MPLLTDFYPEARFGGFTDIDGTFAFYRRVHALIALDSIVVDFGCGRGAYQDDPIALRRDSRILRGRARQVIGLDVDPRASSNPFVDEFRLLEDDCWPLDDAVADLVVSDNVLEHLPNPEIVFAEARRILKPGGYLCIRTPNRLGYVALLSRLLPNKSHPHMLEHIKDSCQSEDVFPTYYRCNTTAAIRTALRKNDFDGVVYGYEAEPSYLGFSRLAYWLGVLHQRFSPGVFKLALFCFARKLENNPS